MDYDGQYEYSETRSVLFDDGTGIGIQVYPNPIQDGQLNVNLDTEQEEAATLHIFDTNGKLLHHEMLSDQHNQVGTGSLSAGVYIIEVRSGPEVWRERLVVK